MPEQSEMERGENMIEIEIGIDWWKNGTVADVNDGSG